MKLQLCGQSYLNYYKILELTQSIVLMKIMLLSI